MKKRLLTSVLAAGGALAMMMSAAGAEPTAQDVLSKYYEASSSVKAGAADVVMDGDVSVTMADQDMTMGLTGHGEEAVQFSMDPFAVKLDANMQGSAMGQEGKMNMQMYMVQEADGSLVMYTGISDPADESGALTWTKQTIAAEEAQKLFDMIKQASAMDFSDMPITYTLAEGTVDVDGIQCYELSSTLTWDDMLNLFKYAMEKSAASLPEEAASTLPDEETLQSVGSLLAGLKMNLKMDINSETYLPVKVHVDFEGTDWTSIGAVIASMGGFTNEDGSPASVSLDVKSLYMDMTYNYDEAAAIEVPEDVKASAQEASPADALSGLESELGAEVESEN